MKNLTQLAMVGLLAVMGGACVEQEGDEEYDESVIDEDALCSTCKVNGCSGTVAECADAKNVPELQVCPYAKRVDGQIFTIGTSTLAPPANWVISTRWTKFLGNSLTRMDFACPPLEGAYYTYKPGTQDACLAAGGRSWNGVSKNCSIY